MKTKTTEKCQEQETIEESAGVAHQFSDAGSHSGEDRNSCKAEQKV